MRKTVDVTWPIRSLRTAAGGSLGSVELWRLSHRGPWAPYHVFKLVWVAMLSSVMLVPASTVAGWVLYGGSVAVTALGVLYLLTRV